MWGYKTAKACIETRQKEHPVLITLWIPSDAKTNIDRTSMQNPNCAKLRTNKAQVVKIEDAKGHTYPLATTDKYWFASLTYRAGETLEVPWDPDVEQVCSKGIHFFLDRTVAENYQKEDISDGPYTKYNDNGGISDRGYYKNGHPYGSWTSYYLKGQIYQTCTYDEDGVFHGEVRRYFMNGNVMQVYHYNHGTLIK